MDHFFQTHVTTQDPSRQQAERVVTHNLRDKVRRETMVVERILAQTACSGYIVIDLKTAATVSNIKGCSGRKYSSAFIGASPFSSQLTVNTAYYAVADSTRAFIHIFRTDKTDSPCYSHAVPEKLPALCFTPCGSICIAGGEKGNIYVWDVSTGALLRCWRGHYKSVVSLSTSPDGAYLFSCGTDSLVVCYNMASILDPRGAHMHEDPHYLHRWSAHRAPITAMTIGGLGQSSDVILLTSSADRIVHVWRPHTDHAIATYFLPSEICHLATNPTSMFAYACCADSNIHILNLGTLVDKLHGTFHFTMTCSVVDIKSSIVPTFSGHSGAVECCTTNIDGSILISCGSDGIRIWDCPSRQTTKHLPNLGDAVIGVSVFRDEVLPLRRSSANKHSTLAVINDSMNQINYSRVPLPPTKAFQRTWTNIAPSPLIVKVSKDVEFYRSLLDSMPFLDPMIRCIEPMACAELQSLDRLIDCADTIEADSLGRTLLKVKTDRKRFYDAVCDMVDTVCSLPSSSSGSSSCYDVNKDENDSCYTCSLPETPISAASFSSYPSSIHPNNPYYHHTATAIPSQARRIFNYVDRSLSCYVPTHTDKQGREAGLCRTSNNVDFLAKIPYSRGEMNSASEVSNEEMVGSSELMSDSSAQRFIPSDHERSDTNTAESCEEEEEEEEEEEREEQEEDTGNSGRDVANENVVNKGLSDCRGTIDDAADIGSRESNNGDQNQSTRRTLDSDSLPPMLPAVRVEELYQQEGDLVVQLRNDDLCGIQNMWKFQETPRKNNLAGVQTSGPCPHGFSKHYRDAQAVKKRRCLDFSLSKLQEEREKEIGISLWSPRINATVCEKKLPTIDYIESRTHGCEGNRKKYDAGNDGNNVNSRRVARRQGICSPRSKHVEREQECGPTNRHTYCGEDTRNNNEGTIFRASVSTRAPSSDGWLSTESSSTMYINGWHSRNSVIPILRRNQELSPSQGSPPACPQFLRLASTRQSASIYPLSRRLYRIKRLSRAIRERRSRFH